MKCSKYSFFNQIDGSVKTIVSELPQELGSSVGLGYASCNKNNFINSAIMRIKK